MISLDNCVKAVFVILLTSVVGCSSRVGVKVGDIPPPYVANDATRAQAEAFVQGVTKEKNFPEIKNSYLLQRIKTTTNRIEVAAGYPKNTFPIHLLDAKDEVNAMAVGGASLVVYKGLLEKVKNDDELAVVLSHEMGHVLGKHAEETGKEEREGIVSIGSTILGSIASVATSAAGLGGLSDLAGDVTSTATSAVGYGALVGSFDREQEYEADHIGLMLMGKAGFNPQVALEFWQNAEGVFGHSHNQASAFFSTHPSFGDRKDALEEAMPFAEKYYQDFLSKNKSKINNSKPAAKR